MEQQLSSIISAESCRVNGTCVPAGSDGTCGIEARKGRGGLGVMGTRRKHVNVLWHLTGFLKYHLSSEDKQELLGLTDDYQQGLLPQIVPLTLLKRHLNRCPMPRWMLVTFRLAVTLYEPRMTPFSQSTLGSVDVCPMTQLHLGSGTARQEGGRTHERVQRKSSFILSPTLSGILRSKSEWTISCQTLNPIENQVCRPEVVVPFRLHSR
jgi:hypothetical protein